MQGPQNVSTKLSRIARLAREAPDLAFTSLNHYIDLEWLREAYRRTRKDGAPGIDGKTAAEYEENLDENLLSLLELAKSGLYRAPPVRRVHIPKGRGSETRPIGIPTFEDKVLQRAVAMLLEAIYEQDFLDCSFGFRPGRSAHQALDALKAAAMEVNGGWVVELDFRKYFDSIPHGELREILASRVRDGVVTRLIGKWLNAGVWERGEVTYPERGSPQGGVISPLLANIFLHEVLDRWFEQEVKPRLSGRAHLIRYADDAVLIFRTEEDARRVLAVLPKRCEKFGLTLHPEKTRLVRFRRPNKRDPDDPGPGSFSFLGFTHHWARGRKGGEYIQRETAKDRFSRSVRAISDWCRGHRHWPIRQQHKTLVAKLRGHGAYYGISGNGRALRAIIRWAERAWQKWLNRRDETRSMPWKRFRRLLKRLPLPTLRIHRPCYAANP